MGNSISLTRPGVVWEMTVLRALSAGHLGGNSRRNTGLPTVSASGLVEPREVVEKIAESEDVAEPRADSENSVHPDSLRFSGLSVVPTEDPTVI